MEEGAAAAANAPAPAAAAPAPAAAALDWGILLPLVGLWTFSASFRRFWDWFFGE